MDNTETMVNRVDAPVIEMYEPTPFPHTSKLYQMLYCFAALENGMQVRKVAENHYVIKHVRSRHRKRRQRSNPRF